MPTADSRINELGRRVTTLESEIYQTKREQLEVLGEIRQHAAGIPFVRTDLSELKDEFKKLNGTVRQNCDRLTKLESTTFRMDAAKVASAFLVMAGMLAIALKLAGVF